MDYVTFVVRILLNDHSSMAEGQIVHVASQETCYFRDLEKAVAFMEAYLDPAALRRHGGDPSAPTNRANGDASDADRS
jgi:hypothetical protein